MIKTELQERITPFAGTNFDVNTGKPAGEEVKGSSDVDFLSVMRSSGQSIQEDRAAQKNGDLSSAKTYDEFLQKMSDATKPKREVKNQLDKDDFLKLFVSQLQHQDPLNPDDGAQMAAQLAQFNGLEQMLNVNKTLEKMSGQQNAARDIQLVDYIGKDVTIDGGRVRLSKGAVSEATANVKGPIAEAILQIRDGSGTMVYERPLGSVQAGEYNLAWDGKVKGGGNAPDGIYTFSLETKGLNGEVIPVEITSKASITGVDIKNKNGGLYTNLGVINLESIKAIGVSGFEADNRQAQAPAPKPVVDAAKENLSPEQAEALLKQMQEQAASVQKPGQPASAAAPQVAPNPGASNLTKKTAALDDVRAANRDSMVVNPESRGPNAVGNFKPSVQTMIDQKGLNEPVSPDERELPSRNGASASPTMTNSGPSRPASPSQPPQMPAQAAQSSTI